MRQMRATPENRQLVYNALKAYQLDTAQAASVETLATRAKLPDEVVAACLDAFVAAQLVVELTAIPDHPLYLLAVSSGGHAKTQPARAYAPDAHQDCQSRGGASAQGSVAGG